MLTKEDVVLTLMNKQTESRTDMVLKEELEMVENKAS